MPGSTTRGRVRLDVHPLGSRAVLVRVPQESVDGTLALLDAEPLEGQREVAAGGASVTVRFATAPHAAAGLARLAALEPQRAAAASGSLVTIDVVYDGDDLADVAAATGRSVDAVVQQHVDEAWRVAFVGFAPGFSYLRGDGRLPVVPRRASPRTHVPAGAVALAGAYAAAYPRTSPGGWQLIGRTDAPLWSLERDEPMLLPTGTRVRFRAVREQARAVDVPPEPLPRADGDASVEGEGRGLVALAVGAQTLVEDLGRPGLTHLGIARSGAADRSALRQANRLVGNAAGAAGIEHVGGGLRLLAAGEHVLAVAGADVDLVVRSRRGDRMQHRGAPFALRHGDVLEVGAVRAGLRVVVGVRGGVAVPSVLGSRSSDLLSGLGPPPVRPDDALPVGPAPLDAVGAREHVATPSADAVLDVVPGPDDDWFGDDARTVLTTASWTVAARSNRVGVRLDGPALARRDGELESQALAPGAIQVPPSGPPVVFLADHPATGGYPVIGVVADHDLDVLAQLAPGARVRLRLLGTAARAVRAPAASDPVPSEERP